MPASGCVPAILRNFDVPRVSVLSNETKQFLLKQLHFERKIKSEVEIMQS